MIVLTAIAAGSLLLAQQPAQVAPTTPDIMAIVEQVSNDYELPSTVLLAMIERESGFEVEAVGDGGRSLGLMQIQPRWHQQRMDDLGCTDMFDAEQNITVGADILAEQLARYDGDMGKALTAYNQGSCRSEVSEYAVEVMARAAEIEDEQNEAEYR